MITADAVKSRFTPLQFETAVVPAVIVEPQRENSHGDENAVNDGGSGKIEHADLTDR